MSGFCCVCHVFPPLVSIYGLFPVLVSCHYELSMFQLCLSRYVLITLCILVLSFEFDFVWSTRYFPSVSMSEMGVSSQVESEKELRDLLRSEELWLNGKSRPQGLAQNLRVQKSPSSHPHLLRI